MLIDVPDEMLRGCPKCEYDEAEGGLFNHCDNCCRVLMAYCYNAEPAVPEKMVLEATSKYVQGYHWVDGVSIRNSQNWDDTFYKILSNGGEVRWMGRNYRRKK